MPIPAAGVAHSLCRRVALRHRVAPLGLRFLAENSSGRQVSDTDQKTTELCRTSPASSEIAIPLMARLFRPNKSNVLRESRSIGRQKPKWLDGWLINPTFCATTTLARVNPRSSTFALWVDSVMAVVLSLAVSSNPCPTWR
jgi:hypothetical protein